MAHGTNVENLRKLAEYLLALPEDYKHFDMGVFMYDNAHCIDVPLSCAHLKLDDCGTVGCALGHGPVAGIYDPTDDDELSWEGYCGKYFMLWDSPAAEWCFGVAWEDVDNTPHGAAKRILYMLNHGVPENYEEQMEGDATLCYLNQEAA
jgi:hypothetical protein